MPSCFTVRQPRISEKSFSAVINVACWRDPWSCKTRVLVNIKQFTKLYNYGDSQEKRLPYPARTASASTQQESLCWPAQNTAPVSLEFLTVGRTSQDQLNILNPIRGLQEHQKTLPIHEPAYTSKHSGLEIETVSGSWRDSLKRSFHH